MEQNNIILPSEIIELEKQVESGSPIRLKKIIKLNTVLKYAVIGVLIFSGIFIFLFIKVKNELISTKAKLQFRKKDDKNELL